MITRTVAIGLASFLFAAPAFAAPQTTSVEQGLRSLHVAEVNDEIYFPRITEVNDELNAPRLAEVNDDLYNPPPHEWRVAQYTEEE